MQFLYHLCPPDMQGDLLLSVNELGRRFPDSFARERPKYNGRDSVLDFEVPFIGVPWGETVNLAALHPRHLVEARRKIGLPLSRLLERRVLRIPVDRVAGLPAAVYDGAEHWINTAPGEAVPLVPPLSEFSRFDAAGYTELLEVPAKHLRYLREQKRRNAAALGFVFVRHVLVAGPIDLRGIEAEAMSG